MSICDRLRTEALRAAISSSSVSASSAPDTSDSFELTEHNRMLAALHELRGYCQTTKARNSFQIFETKLKGGRSQHLVRDSSSEYFELDNGGASCKARARDGHAFERSGVVGQTKVNSKKAVPLPTMRKPEVTLPNIWERLSLNKSKTTGDIAPRHHRRKSSTNTVSYPPYRAESGESLAVVPLLPRVPVSHSRNPSNSSSASTAKVGTAFGPQYTPPRPHLCHCSTSSSLVSRFDKLDQGASVSSIESDHRLPPTPPPPPTAKHSVISISGERYVKSRRECERRSSGEIMKGFWQAGVKQVRKMGQRVGGSTSWVGSGDDLNAMVSGKAGG